MLIVHLGPPEILAIEPVVLDRVSGSVDGGPAKKILVSKSKSVRKGKVYLYGFLVAVPLLCLSGDILMGDDT